jgi:2-C-methyl-D-erythritol 4-phosphate cytidylyltransferase
MNIAVILAGGTGSRMGNEIPKQFLKIAEKTVIEHTIEVFERNSFIDEIAIVVHPDYIDEMNNIVQIGARRTLPVHQRALPVQIIKGGNERYASSLAAVRAYRQFPEYNLLFHDAVRPLVSDRIINDVVTALAQYNAVAVAIPTTDTIFEVDEFHHFIKNIPNRSCLYRAQTPQAFNVKTIQKAFDLALQDVNFQSTDDCGIVAKYLPDEKICVVQGEVNNMKLTYKEDIFLLEALLK